MERDSSLTSVFSLSLLGCVGVGMNPSPLERVVSAARERDLERKLVMLLEIQQLLWFFLRQ